MATTIPGDATRARAFEPHMADQLGTGREAPGWDLGPERRVDDGKTLARQIGWFSIALGVAEIVAAGRLAEALGMDEKEDLFRLYGVREIAQGVAVLSQRRPLVPMWVRVAGDFLDLGTLATGLDEDNPHRDRVAAAMLAVAGVTALDVICARQLARARG
jgi:hypothetical protein